MFRLEAIATSTAIPGATPRASRLRPLGLPAAQVYHRSDARLSKRPKSQSNMQLTGLISSATPLFRSIVSIISLVIADVPYFRVV